MPSIAQETTPPSQSCKKRRRDDNDNSHITLYAGLLANPTSAPSDHRIYSSHSTTTSTTTTTTTTPRSIFNDRAFDSNHGHANLFNHQYTSPLAARKLMPLPFSKKQRTSVERDVEPGMDGEAMQRSPSTSPRQRSRSLADQPPTKHRPELPSRSTGTGAPPTTARLMSRCHICFRKPSKKSDLDSFADCQGCAQRTCYVCMRECLGWGSTSLQQPQIMSMQTDSSFTMLDAEQVAEDVDFGFGKRQDSSSGEGKEGGGAAGWARGGGHRQMVCSRCCIEKGADGDVVCLGCLPFVEG
ncbi:hypothetical protein QBC43DRAFT_282865 [Cladorrhinum sp. PSN259]|nr:hypothetical protein QBC43DRAFT_282865 [Cladorrhinum sp. PSN259]